MTFAQGFTPLELKNLVLTDLVENAVFNTNNNALSTKFVTPGWKHM